MINKKQEYALKKVIERFGKDSQIVVAIEELSELQKELCKSLRGKDNIPAIAEEIADVEIMLAQMKQIFKCGDSVNETVIFKINRTLKILDEKDQEGK